MLESKQMNQIKTQLVQKLNAIAELIRHCATKVIPTQNQMLMQEVSLAVVTHEGLCKLFEQNGPTESVILLVNQFGHAVAELYQNITSFSLKPSRPDEALNRFKTMRAAKRTDKNLLN